MSARPVQLFYVFLCAQLAIAKNNIIKLQEENQQLRSENSLILIKAQQHLEVTQSPHSTEMEILRIIHQLVSSADWVM